MDALIQREIDELFSLEKPLDKSEYQPKYVIKGSIPNSELDDFFNFILERIEILREMHGKTHAITSKRLCWECEEDINEAFNLSCEIKGLWNIFYYVFKRDVDSELESINP